MVFRCIRSRRLGGVWKGNKRYILEIFNIIRIWIRIWIGTELGEYEQLLIPIFCFASINNRSSHGCTFHGLFQSSQKITVFFVPFLESHPGSLIARFLPNFQKAVELWPCSFSTCCASKTSDKFNEEATQIVAMAVSAARNMEYGHLVKTPLNFLDNRLHEHF